MSPPIDCRSIYKNLFRRGDAAVDEFTEILAARSVLLTGKTYTNGEMPYLLIAHLFAALLSSPSVHGQPATPPAPELKRSPCPEGICYSDSLGRTIFWVVPVLDQDDAYTGSPDIRDLQAEYNAWIESRPPLTIMGMSLYGKPATKAVGPALEDDQFFPLKRIYPDGRLNKRTLAIPLYRCRWRLAALLAQIEEEERRLDSTSLGLDPIVLYRTYQEKGILYLSRERLARQAEAVVLAHKAALKFARRLRAVPISGPSSGPSGFDDDRLEADLVPQETIDELAELQVDMEDAVIFAEDLRGAYEDLERP